MALSYVGYASAAANTVALPAFIAGDLALVYAYRDGSSTAPQLPSGWTNIASSGANQNSSRVGRRVLQAGDTTTGVWTNATEVQVLVVRGQHPTTPIGSAGALPSGATGSNRITYPTIQIFGNPVTSWIVGFCGHRTATNVNSGAIASFAIRSAGSVTTSDGCHTRVNAFRHDVGPDTWWFDTDGFDVNASAAWRSYMFELVAAAVNETFTPVAEVSLAPGGFPTSRTLHSLHTRARLTNALHTGVMHLQLFEGVTPRSTVLETTALTTVLADYSVNIADADSALIGNYGDLSIRFQGHSSEGTPTVFEVDRIWLETPAADLTPPPPVFPNVVMLAIVDAGVPLGDARTAAAGLVYLFGDAERLDTQTSIAELSLVSGTTPASRTAHSLHARARVISGSGTLRMALYEGAANITDTAPGYLETTALTTSLADYTLAIANADAAAIGSYTNLSVRFWGYVTGGGTVAFEIDRIWMETPS